MFKLTGVARFSNGDEVRDQDVYELIMKHSRLIDRLNPKKMVEMTFVAFSLLEGGLEMPKKPNWKFYGKH